MTDPRGADRSVPDRQVVEDLVRTLMKGQRALQMYLPNNPMYQRAREQVADAFAPVWGVTGRLVLDLTEDSFQWNGEEVYRQPSRQEGLVSQLYQDGLRQLTLLPGVEVDEVFRLLDVLHRARLLPADAGNDLQTLLWEQGLVLVSYTLVELAGEGTMLSGPGLGQGLGGGDGTGAVAGGGSGAVGAAADAARATTVRDEAGNSDGPPGTVDLADYSSTLHFLDEREMRSIREDLDAEYKRDIRTAALDALLDILETQRIPAVQQEVISLLEELLPSQLATGGFRAVAHLLRELRVIARRGNGLDETVLLSFEERLSTPEILEQLVRALEESRHRPRDEDVSEVLQELKPAALPTLLIHVGRLMDPEVRHLLEPSLERLARQQPHLLEAALTTGDPESHLTALSLTARLGLVQLAPAVAHHLTDPRPAVRIAASSTLATLGTPNAIAALEAVLDDPERTVRQTALELLLARGGSAGTLAKLDAQIFRPQGEQDRAERRMLFEGWGTLVGPEGVERMRTLLEPRGLFRRQAPADVRACALFALAKIRTLDARLLVDRYTRDQEPVVRSAANTVLRDWLL